MNQPTINDIFSKLNIPYPFSVCIYENFMGNKKLNKFKNIIENYRKENTEQMKFYKATKDKINVINDEYTNVNAWCSSYQTHEKTNLFKEYENILNNHCENFYNNFVQNIKLKLADFWIVKYKKGDFAVKHNHGIGTTNIISGCYYIDIEKNASPILFENQGPIYPKKDMLILFPSLLDHEVPKTTGKRLLVSFNFIRKNYNLVTQRDFKKTFKIN